MELVRKLFCSKIRYMTLLIADVLPGVVKLDPWLEPYSDALRRRYSKANEWIETIKSSEGSIENFSKVRFNVYLANCPLADLTGL